MKDRKYFRTSSFYSAVFLFSKGLELDSVDRATNPQRAHFVFVDTPERETLLQGFNSSKEMEPDVQIDARKLVVAIRVLKEKLYEENF